MRAVNLVPADARKGRAAGGGGRSLSLSTFGPAQFLVVLLVIVVVLVLLRVLADNTVNNKEATLAAVQQHVATEQSVANQVSQYVGLVQALEQKEQQVREIAEERFTWKQTLDEISHVLPASTSLTTLSANTAGAATTSSGTAFTGPTFMISGCADTPNQNGVATLLRRLTDVSGVTDVGFQNSTRSPGCGNSFNVTVSFAAPGSTSSASTSAEPSTTGTTTTATTTTTTGPTG